MYISQNLIFVSSQADICNVTSSRETHYSCCSESLPPDNHCHLFASLANERVGMKSTEKAEWSKNKWFATGYSLHQIWSSGEEGTGQNLSIITFYKLFYFHFHFKNLNNHFHFLGRVYASIITFLTAVTLAFLAARLSREFANILKKPISLLLKRVLWNIHLHTISNP